MSASQGRADAVRLVQDDLARIAGETECVGCGRSCFAGPMSEPHALGCTDRRPLLPQPRWLQLYLVEEIEDTGQPGYGAFEWRVTSSHRIEREASELVPNPDGWKRLRKAWVLKVGDRYLEITKEAVRVIRPPKEGT